MNSFNSSEAVHQIPARVTSPCVSPEKQCREFVWDAMNRGKEKSLSSSPTELCWPRPRGWHTQTVQGQACGLSPALPFSPAWSLLPSHGQHLPTAQPRRRQAQQTPTLITGRGIECPGVGEQTHTHCPVPQHHAQSCAPAPPLSYTLIPDKQHEAIEAASSARIGTSTAPSCGQGSRDITH